MNAVDLIVEDESWDAVAGKARLVERAIAQAATELHACEPGVVAILLTSDVAIADLNARYRGKSGPTNVLSFPAAEGVDNHLGDMALAWGVLEREAAASQIPVENHLQHLLIHGFLHLQGYDHQTDEEAEAMEELERRALARLGIADPYQPRDEANPV
jgi:probable rRNA maturation factor